MILCRIAGIAYYIGISSYIVEIQRITTFDIKIVLFIPAINLTHCTAKTIHFSIFF